MLVGAVSGEIHEESGGIVAMEAEDTLSPLGKWVEGSEIDGFSGRGYLEFTGNRPETGPADSPLEFRFRIQRSGLYYLHLRCARERQVILGETRNDVSNDCYVRVEGDYAAGPNAGDDHEDDAPLPLLKKDTKFFGGGHRTFAWASGFRLDPGGHKNKRAAVYEFEAGRAYRLVVSGRSKAFRLDRIVFRHASVDSEAAQQIKSASADTARGAAIRPPDGRLAIVVDGNSPDPDDIGATAVMLGLLHGTGLQARLVHLSHSCDLDPFLNPGKQRISAGDELRRQQKLGDVCREGVEFFGPFPHLPAIFNCRAQRAEAVNQLRDLIDASSAEDPLWILEAGEPDVIGYALDAANAANLPFVQVVTHHPANDNSGDVFTWREILDFGVKEHRIDDQNRYLQTPPQPWDWAKEHEEPRIAWIWNQLKYAEQDGVVAFQKNRFDCSDAGLLYWWITGAADGGMEKGTPTDIRAFLSTTSLTASSLGNPPAASEQ